MATLLTQALGLVRGSPFSELPANSFGWVATELLVSQAEVAVIAAAARLIALALAAGDWPLAAWAVDRGLTASPTAHDLNAGALRAADLSRQADRLAQAWRDVTRRYAAADEPLPDDLTQLHERSGVEHSHRSRTDSPNPPRKSNMTSGSRAPELCRAVDIRRQPARLVLSIASACHYQTANP